MTNKTEANKLAPKILGAVELSAEEMAKIQGGLSLASPVLLNQPDKLKINVGTKLQNWEANLMKEVGIDSKLVLGSCQSGTCTAEGACDCDD